MPPDYLEGFIEQINGIYKEYDQHEQEGNPGGTENRNIVKHRKKNEQHQNYCDGYKCHDR